MRVLLVANVLTHYRLPLYEELQRRVELDIVFYSDGGEWYWQRTSQPSSSSLLRAKNLRGVWLGRTRISPGLVTAVARSRADVIIKDPNGKFALPLTYVAARIKRKPFVLWASLWEHPRTPIHRLSRPLMRYLYRHADALVTYGRHVSEYVVSQGAAPHRVVVSPQAVVQYAVSGDIRERWSGPRRFAYVGRLERWKGLHLLLTSLAPLADAEWRLDIYGEGTERAELERLSEGLGLGRHVIFHGAVPHDALPNAYATAAVVIVPSIRTREFSEPWSLVVNEAMHAGCLVVASDAVGAVRDGLIADNVTGRCFAEGNSGALSKVLADILREENSRVYIGMAEQGRSAAAEYTYERAAEAFVTAAQLALERRR